MDIDRLRKNFGAKIARPADTTCHIWLGSFRGKYGLCWANGVLKTATHVAWFLRHGTWPTQHILHRCDNPPCVNPDHLFEGTDQDNADDRDAKSRSCTKLDHLTRREVQELAKRRPDLSYSALARLFDVHSTAIIAICKGRVRGLSNALPRKPKASTRVRVGDEWLTISNIAFRAGLSVSAVYSRMQRGLTGDQLLAGRHAPARKPYTRKT